MDTGHSFSWHPIHGPPAIRRFDPGKRADGQKIAIGNILFGAAKGGRADG